MEKFLKIFICLIYLETICAKKIAIFTHLECPEPYSDIIALYNCSLTKNSNGFLTMNADLKLTQDVSNLMANFKVKVKLGSRFQETYLDTNIDICEALSDAHKHFLFKLISVEALRTSNLPLECPLKKNEYYFIRNFTINDYFIPPYAPELEFSTYSEYSVNNRKYFTFNSFGNVVDSKFAIYTHLECPKPHVEIVIDYNCSLTNNSNGLLTMNVGLKFSQDLQNITANFKVKLKWGPKFHDTYLNINIDICEALSTAHKHFILKMISVEALRTSNFPLECPLKKNVYYSMMNFTINNYFIPPYAPELEFSTYSDFYVNKRKYLTFNSFGKVVDSKKLNRNSLKIVEI